LADMGGKKGPVPWGIRFADQRVPTDLIFKIGQSVSIWQVELLQQRGIARVVVQVL